MMTTTTRGFAWRISLASLAVCAWFTAAANAAVTLAAPSRTIAVPGGALGIGFDDMAYFPALHRVVVPAGQTGALALIDPTSAVVTTIAGISAVQRAARGHGEGTTSAAYARGFVFASDRDAKQVVIVDPRAARVLGRVGLDAGPDYVRYLPSMHELWVTEPRAQQIEIFDVAFGSAPKLSRVGSIRVRGGPEALLFDEAHGFAYTNLWKRVTIAIGIRDRRVVARWRSGCAGPRGLAMDAKSGFLFVGCAEGKAVVLDARHDGRVLATARTGKGVDIIDYDAVLRHLYVPGAISATLTVLHVGAAGRLAAVGVYRTARGAHCVVSDQHGHVFVCDPHAGRVLEIDDAASGR